MATLRKDSCTQRKPKGERGRTSFYGMYRHTGIKIGTQAATFSAPINDLYGTHVVFGDNVEATVAERNS